MNTTSAAQIDGRAPRGMRNIPQRAEKSRDGRILYIAHGARRLNAEEAVSMGTLATLAAVAAVTLAGVQPQLAAIGEQVYLAFGRGDSVHVARSSDGGLSFGAPVLLPITGDVSLGMRRGPRVVVTNNAVLVAAVSGAQGGGKDGDVVLTRSTDRGRTWSQPVVINDVPGA